MSTDMLTADDVQTFIQAHGLRARLIRDVGHTPTVPAAAEALGVHPDQIVKTLLFLVDTGSTASDEPEPLVVISNGTNRVDRKPIAERFGVGKKRVKLASADVVLDRLGYPAGGVPPFAHRYAVPVLLDQSVVELRDRFGDRIYAGGGDDVTMMELTVTELMQIVQPDVLALTGE